MDGKTIIGGEGSRERVDHDFYATPFWATEALLNAVSVKGSILEPAAGQGHIAKVLKERLPESEVVATDLVEREDRFGVGIVPGIDFLALGYQQDLFGNGNFLYGKRFDNVITNPPFSKAIEFVNTALEIANDKVMMFLKIQFLESQERKAFLQNSPLKYIYVFSNRVSVLNNGEETDENGKKWSSLMCFAWFIWEKGYKGEPILRWL